MAAARSMSTMGSRIRALVGGLGVVLLLGAAAPVHEPTGAEAPCSADVREGLALLARNALAAGQWAEAAGLAERYARSGPVDARTLELLAAAYAIRRGLGHEAEARVDGELLMTLGDGEHVDGELRRRTQQGDWGPGAIDAYLREHGEQLRLARRVSLEARAAQIGWRSACEKGLRDDLCVAVHRAGDVLVVEETRGRATYLRAKLRQARIDAARRRAGKAPRPAPASPRYCVPRREVVHVAVFARDEKAAGAAQRRLERLATLAVAEPQGGELADAVAMARVYAADRRFEELLAVDLADEAAARELERSYRDIAASGRSPAWTVTALARIGQLAEYRAQVLLGEALPPALVDPAGVKARCEQIRGQAAPLLERAVAAYAACHERVITSAQVGEVASACAEALTRYAPRRFPGLGEIFGRAQYTASRPRAVEVQLRP